jgi:hypothetical protein
MAGVAIVYVTHRAEPRFDWFADSLARQLGDPGDLEIVIVDGLHTPARAAALDELVAGRFPFRHVPAKPCPWNGPHRLTRGEHFGAASARNTGIVCSTAPYLVFVDDCSVLGPGWLDEVRAAARHGYVVGGAYEKRRDMVVEDGLLVSSRFVASDWHARDVRWERGGDGHIVEITGGELYGASFGAPRALLLAVNGHDELCDPAGQVDCQLGLRLAWQGARIFYARRMLTIESVELHLQPGTLQRVVRTLDPDAYMERLAQFGVSDRCADVPFDSLGMAYDIAYGTRGTASIGNYYDLRSLREDDLAATVERFPRAYWFDGTPLAEI